MTGRAARLLVYVVLGVPSFAHAQAAVSYQLSFAEREHHLMQVEAVFADVPSGPLQQIGRAHV